MSYRKPDSFNSREYKLMEDEWQLHNAAFHNNRGSWDSSHGGCNGDDHGAEKPCQYHWQWDSDLMVAIMDSPNSWVRLPHKYFHKQEGVRPCVRTCESSQQPLAADALTKLLEDIRRI